MNFVMSVGKGFVVICFFFKFFLLITSVFIAFIESQEKGFQNGVCNSVGNEVRDRGG